MISNKDTSLDWIKSQAENLEKQHTKYQLQIKLNKIVEKEERLKQLKKKVKEKVFTNCFFILVEHF